MKMTMGYEMTGILSDYKEREYCQPTIYTKMKTHSVSFLIADELSKWYPKLINKQDGKVKDRWADGHCIEFPSPVFRSMRSARLFYKRLARLFKKYGVAPKHPVTVCGGNHIHFGGLSLEQMRYAVRLIAANRAIKWVFTHPDDTDSCENFKDYYYFNRGMSLTMDTHYSNNGYYSLEEQIFLFVTSDKSMDWENLSENKNIAAWPNPTYKTLEYRCVEAPDNWKECELQLKFFTALTKLAISLHKRKTRIAIDFAPLNKEKAIQSFNKLLLRLGLEPADYAYLVERNLEPRFEHHEFDSSFCKDEND
jgi:hypothetical protein